MKIIKYLSGFILVLLLLLAVGYVSLEDIDAKTLLPAEKNIVDFHVHVAGLGYGNSGCFVNEEMRNNFRFDFYLKAMGVTEKELMDYGDNILFAKLSNDIGKSKSVSHAVILAMDGVINAEGKLDKTLTQVYIPNDYVYQQTTSFDNLLFAASINPNRHDAIDRLIEVHSQGAMLIKWIPSIMYIDPASPDLTDFYKKMVELDMPLLTHTGMEKSFSGARDELADPLRLELPLQLGVKVIAAHIATTGESEGQDNFERIQPMFDRYPNLYTDISSLTQVNKLGYLSQALAVGGLNKRFIYGTDWPLQFFPLVSPWYHLDQISLQQAKAISKITNQWDRDVALKIAMGLDKESFERGKKLFIDWNRRFL